MCFELSLLVVGLAFYIEQKTHWQTTPPDDRKHNAGLFALYSSAAMVFLFARARIKKEMASIDDALNYGFQLFPVLHPRMPLTGAHLMVHLPLMGFCALTLAAPVFALVSLRWVAVICKFF